MTIVVLDMAWKINPQIKVFTAGIPVACHPRPYQFSGKGQKGINGIQAGSTSPRPTALEQYVKEKRPCFDFLNEAGMANAWRAQAWPLRRKLAGVDADHRATQGSEPGPAALYR